MNKANARQVLDKLGCFLRGTAPVTPDQDRVWDIITALRAIDMRTRRIGTADRLKTLTTARIRAVTQIWTSEVEVSTKALTLEERQEREKLLWSKCVPPHFRSHYARAVWAIRRLYKYDLQDEKPVAS